MGDIVANKNKCVKEKRGKYKREMRKEREGEKRTKRGKGKKRSEK